MIINSIISFLHFICAFGVVFTLIYEKINFKQNLSNKEVRRLQAADKYYGISALLVLIIGFLRVLYFEKGSEFYFSNPFFHIKLTLFIIIGLLSIYPTIQFVKWNKLIIQGRKLALDNKEYIRIKRILSLEVTLIIFLMLSASLMARGITI